jgi:hypothetical protein
VRWTEKAVSLAGMLLLATPALANPWDHSMRPEVQMRAAQDGRADLHESPVASRPEPQAAVRPAPEVMTHRDATLPIKNEISLRARPGDEGDNASNAQAPVTKTPLSQGANDRMGRAEPSIPMPMKTEILLRVQGEAGPDSAVTHGSSAPGAKADKQGNRPLSRAQMKEFIKRTGVNLPLPAEGSDDVEDKTE